MSFRPGLDLARLFYDEAVKPIISRHFPGLKYAAGLIGPGSEVVGFDTEMSTDHNWGPRLMLFLDSEDLSRSAEVSEVLAHNLPYDFRGYSTHFSDDPNDPGTLHLEMKETGPVNHRVDIYRLDGWLKDYCGLDLQTVLNDDLKPADWLSVPGQKLRTLTAGAVFKDDINQLTSLREKLAYYPYDVWLYLLGCGWTRIGQEEPFVGRSGIVGDELGSKLVASRLVHDMMNLCFMMERQYPTYSKLFGSAFASLESARELTPEFTAALNANNWQEREKHLCRAYEFLAALHNKLNLTPPVEEKVKNFWGRPFKVIGGGNIAEAIMKKVTDPDVAKLARFPIGSIEQFSTSTDLLEDGSRFDAVKRLYVA